MNMPMYGMPYPDIPADLVAGPPTYIRIGDSDVWLVTIPYTREVER